MAEQVSNPGASPTRFPSAAANVPPAGGAEPANRVAPGAPSLQGGSSPDAMLAAQVGNENAAAHLRSAPALRAASSSSSEAQAQGNLATTRNAAQQGDVQAQLQLGLMCFYGKGVKQDSQQAFDWFSKAEQSGDAIAQRMLGLMYIGGHGAAPNLEQGVRQISEAARKGDAIAQRQLAAMYFEGKGVAEHLEQAFKWYDSAARLGDGIARKCVISMYESGIHVERNLEKAVQLCLEWASRDAYGNARLDLSNCKIGDEMVIGITARLQQNAKITVLNLENNLVGDEGAKHLATLIEGNTALWYLNLESNPIGEPGLSAIARAMRGNTTLITLLFDAADPSTPMHSQLELIEIECDINLRMAELLEQQQSWKEDGWSGELPLELLKELEKSLICNDVKKYHSTEDDTMRRVLEMQLCLSNVRV